MMGPVLHTYRQVYTHDMDTRRNTNEPSVQNWKIADLEILTAVSRYQRVFEHLRK